jgi:hypothetical protein
MLTFYLHKWDILEAYTILAGASEAKHLMTRRNYFNFSTIIFVSVINVYEGQ